MSSSSPSLLDILSGVAVLQPLNSFEPVTAEIQQIRQAFRGHDGLTARDLEKLKKWALAWRGCAPELQAFYLQFIKTDQTVQIALLHLLNGVQLETWQREHLQNLWQDQYGVSPHLDLHPLNSNLQQMDQT